MGARTASALLAMAAAGALVEDDADVAVAGSAHDAAAAVALLAPGGRIVALADDGRHAARLAEQLHVALRHVEPLATGVAWSGTAGEQPR